MRPKLLDLFCGGGGASRGYELAGFDVYGVDIVEDPRYPYEFTLADAMVVDLSGFDVIHASPPCQAYSRSKTLTTVRYPMLIDDVRSRLLAAGVPYIIENVPGSPLRNPLELCGDTFGLRSYRHRLFESNVSLVASVHGPHTRIAYGNRDAPIWMWDHGAHVTVMGNMGRRYGPAAMGIDWLWGRALGEAIPPAFTHYVGDQIMDYLMGCVG